MWLKESYFFDLFLECAKGLLGVDLRGGDVVVAQDAGQPDEHVARLLWIIIYGGSAVAHQCGFLIPMWTFSFSGGVSIGSSAR